MNFLQIGFISDVEVAQQTLYASIIISVITFIFNAISIYQTSRAQKDIAKPYVNLYVDIAAVKDSQRFYVMKNFGTTPAYIKSIEFYDKSNSLVPDDQNPFKSLEGNMLAPGQRVTSYIPKDETKSYNVKFMYIDTYGKQYIGASKLDTQAFEDLSFSYHSSGNDVRANAIRESALALIRELKN